jgi:hypothetical protein
MHLDVLRALLEKNSGLGASGQHAREAATRGAPGVPQRAPEAPFAGAAHHACSVAVWFSLIGAGSFSGAQCVRSGAHGSWQCVHCMHLRSASCSASTGARIERSLHTGAAVVVVE